MSVSSSDVTLQFDFTCTNGDTRCETLTADVDFLLDDAISDFEDDTINELDSECEDSDDTWSCDGWAVIDENMGDSDMLGYDHFKDISDWVEYVEKCEEHGEAYVLRYADIGEHDFDDEYQGRFDDEESFAQYLYEELYDIPDHLANHIDWDSVAREVMMDYSSYQGCNGYYHIFRS